MATEVNEVATVCDEALLTYLLSVKLEHFNMKDHFRFWIGWFTLRGWSLFLSLVSTDLFHHRSLTALNTCHSSSPTSFLEWSDIYFEIICSK